MRPPGTPASWSDPLRATPNEGGRRWGESLWDSRSEKKN